MTQETAAATRKISFLSILSSKELILLLRVVLGITFIYASHDKIMHPQAFAIAVRAYKIIPLEISNLFTLMLAWSEITAGVLLLLGIGTKKAASAIFILTCMFIVAIAVSLVRGFAISCGCFSSEGGHLVDIDLLVRDVFLLLAAFLIIRFDSGFLSVGKLFTHSRNQTD
jgi:uncharacterized membrane protein YphA (DoxX/SURF4 family)